MDDPSGFEFPAQFARASLKHGAVAAGAGDGPNFPRNLRGPH